MTNAQIGQIFNGLTFSAVAKVYVLQDVKGNSRKQGAEEEGGKNYFCFVLIQGLTPQPSLVCLKMISWKSGKKGHCN